MRSAAVIAALVMMQCARTAAPVETRSSTTSSAQAPAREAAWRSCLLDGTSPCMSRDPIHVGSDLIAWSDWLGQHAEAQDNTEGLIECRWVAELENVLLCGGSHQPAVNAGLTRASIFVENKPRVVVPYDDPLYGNLVKRIGGHDLMKQHPSGAHPDLLGFFAAVDKACPVTRSLCSEPAEQAMRKLLESAWANRASFVVLTFSRYGSVADDEAVSHEILHAQYFTNDAYRQVVADYWASLPELKRAEIRTLLSKVYSPDNDELIQNEMQAYALMTGGERSYFRALVEHRARLLELLAKRGIKPVVVQQRAVETVDWS